MNLKDYSIEVERILLDEELLRYLYYTPKNRIDNPLDVSKTNIFDMPEDVLWDIIDNHLIPAIKIDDLDKNPICRVFYYAGIGKSSNTNYLYGSQEYIFDVFVHNDYQIRDKRLETICDRINYLISNKRIGGIGKTLFKRKAPIGAPDGYMGFRLIYEFYNESNQRWLYGNIATRWYSFKIPLKFAR